MPEGDTIFRTARTLDRAFRDQVVTAFHSVYPHLLRVHEDRPVTGRTVEAVTSHGKHLLMQFSGGLTLHTHMRMSGSWHLYRTGERWRRPRDQMRVLLEAAGFVAVAFNVSEARFLEETALERDPVLNALGPDLLSDAFDADAAAARFRSRPDDEIATVLLDQRIVAGAGNVFKCEVLFLAGVSPFTRVRDLPPSVLERIVATARRLLALNVRPGAEGTIVTRSSLRRTTDPSERLWVYGRGGKPCHRCGTPVRYAKQGPDARGTYWCPACQPAATGADVARP